MTNGFPWLSGAMNFSTSCGQPVVEPNQTTRHGSFIASSTVISNTEDAGLQYKGSIAPALRVEPARGPSTIVHHLGSLSKGLRGGMNIGQQERGNTSSSHKSYKEAATSIWRVVYKAAGKKNANSRSYPERSNSYQDWSAGRETMKEKRAGDQSETKSSPWSNKMPPWNRRPLTPKMRPSVLLNGVSTNPVSNNREPHAKNVDHSGRVRRAHCNERTTGPRDGRLHMPSKM
mmetsp:Transcript_6291/g.10623  ORF Transcript_6291/g.10623 Transcript_6291/m.10623 type:complete len:231 (-) Transcript_6291:598-1290(-)